jgi:hypothetical protein
MTNNNRFLKYYFLLQLPWIALDWWSVSFAIHGILLKYIQLFSQSHLGIVW